MIIPPWTLKNLSNLGVELGERCVIDDEFESFHARTTAGHAERRSDLGDVLFAQRHSEEQVSREQGLCEPLPAIGPPLAMAQSGQEDLKTLAHQVFRCQSLLAWLGVYRQPSQG